MESPITPQQITEQVLASFEATPDPRRRELMRAFVSHLHAFVTEVGLTEEEWAAAIGALTATGHLTDDKRQEFILWSDTLGVSMLVDSIANAARREPPSRRCSARSTSPTLHYASTAPTWRSRRRAFPRG